MISILSILSAFRGIITRLPSWAYVALAFAVTLGMWHIDHAADNRRHQRDVQTISALHTANAANIEAINTLSGKLNKVSTWINDWAVKRNSAVGNASRAYSRANASQVHNVTSARKAIETSSGGTTDTNDGDL